MKVTDEMVNRFLSWKLPEGFAPDCGISFDGRPNDFLGYPRQWPTGTNLFTSEQARQMLEHVVQGNPWLEGINEACVNSGLDVVHPDESPKQVIERLVHWNVQIALDPSVSSEAAALVEKGRQHASMGWFALSSSPHALHKAARELLEACYVADTQEELAANIDGSLLDSLSTALDDTGQLLTDSMNAIVNECHAKSVAGGWWHDLHSGEKLNRNVGEMIALIHSEVSEALEGHRKGLMDDKLPHRKMIEVELADAIIRIADLAGGLELDLGGALTEKIAYNARREDHKPENRKLEGGKKY